jgi:hypothetical protein
MGVTTPAERLMRPRRRISMKPPAPLRPGHTMSISRLPHIEQSSRSLQSRSPIIRRDAGVARRQALSEPNRVASKWLAREPRWRGIRPVSFSMLWSNADATSECQAAVAQAAEETDAAARVMITDELGSYGAAKREFMPRASPAQRTEQGERSRQLPTIGTDRSAAAGINALVGGQLK